MTASTVTAPVWPRSASVILKAFVVGMFFFNRAMLLGDDATRRTNA